MKRNSFQKMNINDKIAIAISLAICAISCLDIVRYMLLGNETAFASMCIINAAFILLAICAWSCRAYFMYLPVTVAAIVLFSLTNNIETSLFNITFLFQAILSGIGCLVGGAIAIIKKRKPKKATAFFLVIVLLIAAVPSGIWGWNYKEDAQKESVSHTTWSVPKKYDAVDCPQKGSLQTITYTTKAYATDKRTVTKQAMVYLPYNYNEEAEYDVLYLLHGTGDNERYWLEKFAYNATMVDNLIYYQEIKPIIIVTPTWYVEEDCMDGSLDPLTYTFKEELRNDLMPAVEGRYATYAKTTDEKGFIESRTHRAFAGLSRGAVTTLHSVFCGALDYFSRFGVFSASRTTIEEFKLIQTDTFKDYPIDYFYMTSGVFDFSLERQVRDMRALLSIEPRLVEGENCQFDVFPMQYHSMTSWHLALYNCLQYFFQG
ncbi:MAG: hypothetical protein IJW96_00935 [Clostridia bacterium]|nr:hypothetical protein [Clostridia bacterium]